MSENGNGDNSKDGQKQGVCGIDHIHGWIGCQNIPSCFDNEVMVTKGGEHKQFINDDVKCPDCGRYRVNMENTGMRCLHCEVI